MQAHKVLTTASVYPRYRLNSTVLAELTSKYTGDVYPDIAATSTAVPYFCIVEVLLGFLAQERHENAILEDKLKNFNKLTDTDLNILRFEKLQVQQTLDQFIEDIKPERARLKAVQDENVKIREDHEKAIVKLAAAEAELGETRRAINKENDNIVSLTYKLKAQKQETQRLVTEVEAAQTDCTNQKLLLQNMSDNLNVALKRLKHSQKQKETLENELMAKDQIMKDLNVRAAVAFDELTPRPSLTDLCTLLDVCIEGKTSTIDKCRKILKAARNIRSKAKRAPSSRRHLENPIEFPDPVPRV